MASTSSPPPSERASEIINKLPSSPSLITKTGTAILGTGLLATAISQELYVMNEESILALGSFILFAFIAKVCFLCDETSGAHICICSLQGSPTVTGQKAKFSASKAFSIALAWNTLKLSKTASHPLNR